MTDDEERDNLFYHGLRENLRQQLIALKNVGFSELVEATRTLESAMERTQRRKLIQGLFNWEYKVVIKVNLTLMIITHYSTLNNVACDGVISFYT
ncbi:hypothetical protein KSP40_PGU007795 [Platanthera guangdongensis]|uniref:Uncharacterized protein n=1 Tax=Platanthera guangdongensis TaxID=2320717 RepID=A0ABR2LKX2_9ASPA